MAGIIIFSATYTPLKTEKKSIFSKMARILARHLFPGFFWRLSLLGIHTRLYMAQKKICWPAVGLKLKKISRARRLFGKNHKLQNTDYLAIKILSCGI